ncbi:MAG: hypothetical protein IKR72_02830 [Bacteroidales bacterium]|nr:hypothetical protein [Bacteroidales bacterium]
MKVLNYILIIISINLPILVCWKFSDVTELPAWIWVPGIIIPLVALYLVAKKSERPEWKGLQDTGTAFYYGTWAVEVSILAGVLAFFRTDMVIPLMKAAAVLYAVTLVCRIFEWTGVLQKFVGRLAKSFDE